MQYYVFEDDPTNKAIVHKGSCRFCNEGKGIHGIVDSPNCRWHGPFDTVEAAEGAMIKTGRRGQRKCQKCF